MIVAVGSKSRTVSKSRLVRLVYIRTVRGAAVRLPPPSAALASPKFSMVVQSRTKRVLEEQKMCLFEKTGCTPVFWPMSLLISQKMRNEANPNPTSKTMHRRSSSDVERNTTLSKKMGC